jgi:hypothetical protein
MEVIKIFIKIFYTCYNLSCTMVKILFSDMIGFKNQMNIVNLKVINYIKFNMNIYLNKFLNNIKLLIVQLGTKILRYCAKIIKIDIIKNKIISY